MLGIGHVVDPSEVPEIRAPSEDAGVFAGRLAREKAGTTAARHPDTWVLGADTVVVLGEEVLGKPESPEDAEAMLRRLSGHRHEVITAVALVRGPVVHECQDVTSVWFRDLTPDAIRGYVATGEPLDKAGAYGIQGLGAAIVERIDGDYFNVMGLPVRRVVDLLEAAGMPYSFTR